MDIDETEIDITPVLGTTLLEILDYHLEHHLSTDLFISVKLRENKCLIDDGYYVDWKRRVLVFTNINYTLTYRMIIAVNQLYINNLLSEMYNRKL